jgi:nucleoid-associated protein YgaU
MSRYSGTNIIRKQEKNSKETKSKMVYSTTIYQKIPLRDDDLWIITTAGDRLDTLAQRFYKDSRLWWYIAKANNLVTMNIEDGTSLRIPASLQYTDSDSMNARY